MNQLNYCWDHRYHIIGVIAWTILHSFLDFIVGRSEKMRLPPHLEAITIILNWFWSKLFKGEKDGTNKS